MSRSSTLRCGSGSSGFWSDCAAPASSRRRDDGLASRLGIPASIIDQLRAAGELVAVAPGIDYPRDVHAALLERLDRMAGWRGPVDVGRVPEIELRASRRSRRRCFALDRVVRPRRCGLQQRPRRISAASAGGQLSPAAARACRNAAAGRLVAALLVALAQRQQQIHVSAPKQLPTGLGVRAVAVVRAIIEVLAAVQAASLLQRPQGVVRIDGASGGNQISCSKASRSLQATSRGSSR